MIKLTAISVICLATTAIFFDSWGGKTVMLMDQDGTIADIKSNGILATAPQNRTTQTVIVNFNRIANNTTLSTATTRDARYIIVDDTTGAAANDYVVIFNPDSLRFSKFNTMSINIDTLFLDRPMDVAYPVGSFVDLASTNLAVDGSSVTQVFGLRGVSPSPIGVTVHITRIIFTCITDAAVDLSKFADIAGGLTNGLQLRKRDGMYYNIENFKTNFDIAGTMFDWTPHAAANPVQGQDGFVARFTFTRVGTVIELAPGQDLELLVSDALQTIPLLEAKAEGYIVQN